MPHSAWSIALRVLTVALVGALLLGLVGTLCADIELAKDTFDPGEPIIATVSPSSDIPAGANLKGTLTVSGVSGVWQPDLTQTKYGIWAAAGEHTITVIGSWLLVDPATGKAVDHNWYRYTRTFTQKGPGPDPPPPPPPDGKWQVAFFFNGEDMVRLSLPQVDMISGLAFRQELVSKGHFFVGAFEKDSRTTLITENCANGICRTTTSELKYKAFWDAVAGKTFPCIAIAPVSGGEVPLVFPLPADRDALYKLLASTVVPPQKAK